ncbi:MAG: MlaD family protein [Pseudomonadota bacterium]
METRANFALIGALVLVAAAALIGAVLWLSQSQFNKEFAVYDMVFDGPVLLEEGASVRFNGILVGEVSRVAIDRNNDTNVRARVRIDAETPVRVDSVARIDFAGITGATFVQIQAGEAGSTRVRQLPGEAVPLIDTEPNPLTTLFDGSSDLVALSRESLLRVNALLSDENMALFQGILQNVEGVTGTLDGDDGPIGRLAGLIESLQSTGAEFEQMARSVSALADSANTELAGLSGEFETLLNEFQTLSARAEDLLVSGREAADAAQVAIAGPASDAFIEYRLLAQDIRQLNTRIDGLMRRIENDPQAFLVGDQLPYEGAR